MGSFHLEEDSFVHPRIVWNSRACQDYNVVITVKIEPCQSIAKIIPTPLNIRHGHRQLISFP